MSQPLIETIERIQLDAQKKAHEAYAQQLELGMNSMIQAVRRHSSTAQTPESAPVNLEEVKP